MTFVPFCLQNVSFLLGHYFLKQITHSKRSNVTPKYPPQTYKHLKALKHCYTKEGSPSSSSFCFPLPLIRASLDQRKEALPLQLSIAPLNIRPSCTCTFNPSPINFFDENGTIGYSLSNALTYTWQEKANKNFIKNDVATCFGKLTMWLLVSPSYSLTQKIPIV